MDIWHYWHIVTSSHWPCLYLIFWHTSFILKKYFGHLSLLSWDIVAIVDYCHWHSHNMSISDKFFVELASLLVWRFLTKSIPIFEIISVLKRIFWHWHYIDTLSLLLRTLVQYCIKSIDTHVDTKKLSVQKSCIDICHYLHIDH